MAAFGFNSRCRDLVWRLVQGNWYSIRLGGVAHGFFASSRGVKQGDPLSPLLFIIAQEVLSRATHRALRENTFQPYEHGRGGVPISHLLYADDMLIFCNGRRGSIEGLRGVMNRYERASGQLINLEKSGYHYHHYYTTPKP